jgi:alkylhydroperoxidase family enzyme
MLQGSMALWDLFTTTSFSEIEQQVIYLTANYEHECDYCMAAHWFQPKRLGCQLLI